jgi:hypothetical protein
MLDPYGDDSDTVFRDVITLALAGFMFMTVLLLPHINPQAKKAEGDADPPGNVIVEAHWDPGLRTDVDLWVQAPGDVPVGYSNKSGLIFNLLRDDLGMYGDPTETNMENVYSRGIPPGEYAVNLHLYRNSAQKYPVEVRVVVRVKANAQANSRAVVSTKVQLEREGQEITAFRFKLAEGGELVPGSVHALYKPLRAAKTKA